MGPSIDDILAIRSLLALRGERRGKPVVFLISCSKAKGKLAAKARDLYASARFKKSVGIAESLERPYFILSAKYGLLSHQCVIPPYDLAVADMTHGQQSEWGSDIGNVVSSLFPAGAELWVLASKHYTNPIKKHLSSSSYTFRTPLDGLSLGQTSQWLSAVSRSFERTNI